MKRSGRLSALLLALACLVTPAHGLASSGDLIGPLDSRRTELTTGSCVSAWSTLSGRFDQLEKTFGVEVALELWSSPAEGGYTSAEDMRALAAGQEDRITLIYTPEGSSVHMGREVGAGCNLSAVEKALTDPAAGDYDRLMGGWRALWAALADGEAVYPTRVEPGDSTMTRTQVEAALVPLRQVFTGPVTVICGRGEEMEKLTADVVGVHSPYEEDALLLCYGETTGAVGVYVGTLTGLKLTGEGKVAAAFAAGGSEGFTRGVEELAQRLTPLDSRGPWTIPLTAAGVALIALGELWWRRRRPRA